MFIFRPSPDRPHVLLGFYILETGVLHPTLEVETGARFDAGLAGGFDEFVVERFAGVAFL